MSISSLDVMLAGATTKSFEDIKETVTSQRLNRKDKDVLQTALVALQALPRVGTVPVLLVLYRSVVVLKNPVLRGLDPWLALGIGTIGIGLYAYSKAARVVAEFFNRQP